MLPLFLCVQVVYANGGILGKGGQESTATPAPKATDGGALGLENVVGDIFLAVIGLIGSLIAAAVSLIDLTLKPQMMDIINNRGVYAGWKTVRDILNMFFIFFLLYSAFCTVFQISKYHIRNTWVMIVVMALLVNFSWPITRVLIDVSNVTMSYILHGSGNSGQGAVSGSGIMAKFADKSQFATLVIGEPYFDSSNNLIMSKKGVYQSIMMGIIVGIVFLMTIGTIAAVLVVRVVALAIYLIFASVGYIMAAFPGTRTYSSQWWSGFTKQLIVGPITLFAIVLAISILDELGRMSVWTSMGESATKGSTTVGLISTLLQYLIAILVMWGGILAAQKVGADGTSFALGVAGKARGKIKSLGKSGAILGARTADGLMGAGVNYLARSESGVDKSVARGLSTLRSLPTRARNFKENSEKRYRSNVDESIARGVSTAPGLMGGDKQALERNRGKKIEDEKKKMREAPVNTATNIENEAKAQVLSEKKADLLDTEVEQLIETFSTLDAETQKAVKKKMRESGYGHRVLEMDIAHEEAQRQEVARTTGASPLPLTQNEMDKMAQNVFGGMNVATLAKQKASTVYRDTSAAAGTAEHQRAESAYLAMRSRYERLTLRAQQDFQNAQSTEQAHAFAGAENRYNTP